jgi:hypothetical protein
MVRRARKTSRAKKVSGVKPRASGSRSLAGLQYEGDMRVAFSPSEAWEKRFQANERAKDELEKARKRVFDLVAQVEPPRSFQTAWFEALQKVAIAFQPMDLYQIGVELQRFGPVEARRRLEILNQQLEAAWRAFEIKWRHLDKMYQETHEGQP